MTEKQVEQRSCCELRFVEDDSDSPKIVGYAAVFDSLSSDLGGFREKIDRGAFAQSLDEGDEVHALYNHDSNKLLGRRGAGTLRLHEDDHGLKIEIDPPNTTDGNDVVELLRRNDLVSMSFGFFNTKDSWETDGEGNDIRTIKSARLFDISVVCSPAYDQTECSVRCEPALESQAEYHAFKELEATDFDAIGETEKLKLRLRLAEGQ